MDYCAFRSESGTVTVFPSVADLAERRGAWRGEQWFLDTPWNIARAFGYVSPAGRSAWYPGTVGETSITAVCLAACTTATVCPDDARVTRYEFAEGPSILVHGDAWDLQAADCSCGWCSAIDGAQCDKIDWERLSHECALYVLGLDRLETTRDENRILGGWLMSDHGDGIIVPWRAPFERIPPWDRHDKTRFQLARLWDLRWGVQGIDLREWNHGRAREDVES